MNDNEIADILVQAATEGGKTLHNPWVEFDTMSNLTYSVDKEVIEKERELQVIRDINDILNKKYGLNYDTILKHYLQEFPEYSL